MIQVLLIERSIFVLLKHNRNAMDAPMWLALWDSIHSVQVLDYVVRNKKMTRL